MSVLYLVVQGAVFLVWIVLMAQLLLALRAEAVSASGSTMPGLRASVDAFRLGLVSPRYGRDRRRIGIVTVVLLVLAVLAPVAISNG
ncbi:hypothetical protein EMQ25_02415 [Arsenicitalea aurantiaca]|uniref:YggT family protein n=1 Tax=Arsenicitalea aurantiaca TaxID=1783274 RepID=A0A433XL88_9HYPH|nr:hypothetical protein [Arsenicitalea aurantiaca]RUT34833.1 hypothetical protein EMQ25_02415 [Arsenicitalea aurantiaca]